ncbi:putative wall-associated receptor kinase-like protein 16 [Cinnamomum micranthum f. kanehirae]|uniref:Putative wall-associated receptor kinase-like protein 16 n=1 Tax=Cinnamomum micranthum f. kanehirae TaxID=337451 RepID=A0A443NKF7_9MAGN|nr:putative wall-associated receptor kinase-like protein 16 [Cinnamomum micranthum f. kanehirae]
MGCWHMLLGILLLTAASAFHREPDCPDTDDSCGNVSIPYPFGIKKGCSREGFELTCNETSNNQQKPCWGGYEITKITLEGQANVFAYAASDCYNESGRTESYYSSTPLSEDGPFTFSDTRNKFTAIGCDTVAYITGYYGGNSGNFSSGCVSVCWEKESVIDGNCTGIGCCQTSIPQGATRFVIELTSLYNHNSILDFNPCSFAFLMADDDQFKFNFNDLSAGSQYGSKLGEGKKVPLVLDWAIGNETCAQAKENPTSYACKSSNSICYEPTNGPGYRCNCSKGYEGNPYLELQGGCKDINECERGTHNCTGKCKNEEGSFSCPHRIRLTAAMILGTVSSFLFVFIVGSWLYWGLKKRKLLQLKEKFFRQNGGLLLQQQITSHRVGATTKIFSAEELERATNKYHETRIIGRGGYGTVYKGILPDHTIVAIKKTKIVDKTQIEQFINEVFILSQINHRNVVKLLGCCLETQVPLLVYEFISNGTLSDHIHDEAHSSSLSLENRLRIASETAGALSYLHSAASIPIFHRDVKSANILLDENLTTKVSDFGASRLVPLDQTQITTLVQGTLGYLDPEYFHTGQLTEKSDVYSFGVVLVELLTGEKPICMNRSQEERSLSMYFVKSLKEHRLFQVLENRIVDEGGVDQLVAVAELAKRCLKVKGEERPSMKEVAMELEGLKRAVEHPWVQKNHEETQSLLGETSAGYNGNGSVIGQDSLTNHNMSALEIGR